MADIGSVAARIQVALESMNKTVPAIATALGIEPPSIPKTGRDVTFLRMQQIETVAKFLETVQEYFYPARVDEVAPDTLTATLPGETTWNPAEGATFTPGYIPPLSAEEHAAIAKAISRDYNVAELEQIADDQGKEYASGIRKAELIDLLINGGFRGKGEPDGDTGVR